MSAYSPTDFTFAFFVFSFASFAFSILALELWRTWWRLKHIPGPFWASLSDFPRMSWVRTKRHHLILQEQHEKYGDMVRIGPNMVSFSNAEAIPSVYIYGTGFPKSLFYRTLQPYSPKGGSLPAIFNTQDEALHKRIKSPIAPLYSLTSMVGTEDLVDDTISLLKEKLDDRFAATAEVCDLGEWIQFWAFDVMGQMTFSKHYGFLEEGKDVGGMLSSIRGFMRSCAQFTQIPWLDWLAHRNIVGHCLRPLYNPAAVMPILGFGAKAIAAKRAELAKIKESGLKGEEGRKDFLAHFVEIQDANQDIPPWQVNQASTAWVFSNVIAGSASVGTILRSTLFHLLAYPHTCAKLVDELRNAELTMPIPKHAEVQNLPYLDVCILEGSRLVTPFALPLERVVPAGGITVLGRYLPEGTCIGGSPYVVNRDKKMFGENAEFWRPERWLEGGEAGKRRLEASLLTFGSGRRVCMGKNVGIYEIKKLIAFLLVNYDLRIVDKEKFQSENSWMWIQKGFFAQIEWRRGVS